MRRSPIDPEKLRVALRQLGRDDLLHIVESAIGLVPKAKMGKLVGSRVRLEDLAPSPPGAASLLAEVKKFHAAALRGEYYQEFAVNSKNYREQSRGTARFTAEHHRLMGRCVRAASRPPRAPVRAAFELLFALLPRIDETEYDVIFLADERGSFQVGLDCAAALPAYFRCLADSASPEEFAREVHRTIADFAEYERPRHLAAARRVASAEQKAELGRRRARADG